MAGFPRFSKPGDWEAVKFSQRQECFATFAAVIFFEGEIARRERVW
jgi:hypothetical protein